MTLKIRLHHHYWLFGSKFNDLNLSLSGHLHWDASYLPSSCNNFLRDFLGIFEVSVTLSRRTAFNTLLHQCPKWWSCDLNSFDHYYWENRWQYSQTASDSQEVVWLRWDSRPKSSILLKQFLVTVEMTSAAYTVSKLASCSSNLITCVF